MPILARELCRVGDANLPPDLTEPRYGYVNSAPFGGVARANFHGLPSGKDERDPALVNSKHRRARGNARWFLG